MWAFYIIQRSFYCEAPVIACRYMALDQLVGKTNCSPHGYTATLTLAAYTKRPNCPLAWNIVSITHFQIVKQEIFQPMIVI